MRTEKTLIIIQAAADVRYAFDLIKEIKGEINLLVVGLHQVYKLTKELNLDSRVDIVFLDTIPLDFKEPHKFIACKKEKDKMLEREVINKQYNTVYFFSIFYDWMTAAMIDRIIQKKHAEKVIYYDHYDSSSVKNDIKQPRLSYKGLRNLYFILVLRFVSGVHLITRFKTRFVEFKYWDYPIERISAKENTGVLSEYLYRLEDGNRKRVLFLLSPSEEEMIVPESYKSLINAFKLLEKCGYDLYVKGHPRLGVPKRLNSYFKNEIPSYVPSEFLDYTEFEFIAGVMSSGLVYPSLNSNLKVFAFIQMLRFYNDDDKKFYTSFLKEHSKNKVILIDSLENFERHFKI